MTAWGKLISTTGSLAATLGIDQPFRYRGYVYDRQTGLYYLQSRYYDPETCRFISADVYLSTGQGVVGNNSFAYCLNDPLIQHDPAGTWSRNNSDKSNVNDGGTGFFGTFTGWAKRTWTNYYPSQNAAMRAAKRSVNIPYSATPTLVVEAKMIGKNGRVYLAKYEIYGDKFIRNDYGDHLFRDGASLPRHYNVGTYQNKSFKQSQGHFYY